MASSSPSTSSWKYDVFLSFRGQDTRLGFTSHLCNALKQSGIRTFMDDVGIKRGKEISDSLEQAIERSRIVLVILSPDYASSKWCLDELRQIMEHRATLGQLVTPIFYKVDPSDVRHQRGTYGDAMERHEQRLGTESDRVLRWRQALTELGNIQGFSYSACQYRNQGPESELIDIIVEDVSRKLGVEQLFVANPPVGTKSRVHEQTVELFDYDVFLSFRGEDTGRGFTSHLYSALRRSGIHAFMDNTEIEWGEEIYASLLQVIERSRFALVVLSPNYASSGWCLDKLVKIIECEQSMDQLVIPIFYEVDSYDMYRQSGRYGEAMKQHEQRLGRSSERLLRWRAALARIAKIQGFSFSGDQHRLSH